MSETTSPDLLKKLESRRFQVTNESGETLRRFRDELKEFMEQHPEIVGSTVYGSHTKGKARGENDPDGKSDIDSFIFIDEDKVDDINPESDSGISTIDSPNWKTVNDGVGQEFKDLFAEAGSYSEEQMKGMSVRLISKSRIDNDIDEMYSYLQKMDDFENGLSERPSFNERPMENDIGRLFQFQLGKGLDSYRAYILDELKQKGDLGDKIWEVFIFEDTLSTESQRLVKALAADATDYDKGYIKVRKSLFPHSVDEAVKYYHTEKIEPKYK